jgi:3'-phosphoadenosine 5'-phosphosulfate sulfotransferase (PAPS reductase)/FAD synthetase
MSDEKVRHILSLSGGKDSTALAIYMQGKIPDVEYVFCDTGEELPETYEYLDKLEAHLGKPIIRLNPDRPFKHFLDLYGGILPDARARWCTRMLKLRPFENHIGEDRAISYIAIRADEEHRKGYISKKNNIEVRYPFITGGINKEGVHQILKQSGLGLPEYYKWRSRSGCYFCFFQQKIEWVGLLEKHPDLYKKAAAYEKDGSNGGERFTWVENESLLELANPSRVEEIKSNHKKRIDKESESATGRLLDLLESDDYEACTICKL